MEFKLDLSQMQRLIEWQDSIKEKYGEYGSFTFGFTPTGIGTYVHVFSSMSKETLNLSDVDKW